VNMTARALTGVEVFDSTALSPEWDRWFDEAFTDLISGDEDLVRAEFDALIAASWQQPPPPPPPAPPGFDPPGSDPPATGRHPRPANAPAPDTEGGGPSRDTGCQRAPPGAVRDE